MANSIYTDEDYKFVKSILADKPTGVSLEEIIYRCHFTSEQLTYIFNAFRKERYRVFIIEKYGEKRLILKDDYMRECGYNDRIVTDKDSIKIVLISDTHFGSKNDNPRIMYKVYDFCKEKGVEHIIHLGDVIEGKEYYVKQSCKSSLRYSLTDECQLENLNNNMPYDKGITTHVLAGNHDSHTNDGIALDIVGELIKTYDRSDIAVAGFDYAKFPVNNDVLYLNHGFIKDFRSFENDLDNNLILCGHSHWSKNDIFHGYVVEYVTTLSNIEHINPKYNKSGGQFYVGFVTLDIKFNEDKMFDNIVISRYALSNNYFGKPELQSPISEVEFCRVRK